MPRITLPDGSVKEFPQPVTAKDVAASIGPGLAKRRAQARRSTLAPEQAPSCATSAR